MVLVGNSYITDDMETRLEDFIGLAVRTNNIASTRMGLVQLFYSEPYPDNESAIRRHKVWLDFVASDKTDLYWRFVVLQ